MRAAPPSTHHPRHQTAPVSPPEPFARAAPAGADGVRIFLRAPVRLIRTFPPD